MSWKTAIGIDLGTTNSCVGVFRIGEVEIIANEKGITPSFVAFTVDEKLVGERSKKPVQRNPENSLYEVKRHIGCKYNEKNLQKNILKIAL